jgi:hypothetical protein
MVKCQRVFNEAPRTKITPTLIAASLSRDMVTIYVVWNRDFGEKLVAPRAGASRKRLREVGYGTTEVNSIASLCMLGEGRGGVGGAGMAEVKRRTVLISAGTRHSSQGLGNRTCCGLVSAPRELAASTILRWKTLLFLFVIY